MDIEFDFSKILSYNPDTGVLTYKNIDRSVTNNDRAISIFNAKNAGKEAGSIRDDGYLQFSTRIPTGKKMTFICHRVAWFMHHGKWPFLIDHINGNRSDNRIENLREISSYTENNRNLAKSSSNSTGVTGVGMRNGKYYRSYIRVNGRQIELGQFKDLESAVAARMSAEKKYKFHQNHGKRDSMYAEIDRKRRVAGNKK